LPGFEGMANALSVQKRGRVPELLTPQRSLVPPGQRSEGTGTTSPFLMVPQRGATRSFSAAWAGQPLVDDAWKLTAFPGVGRSQVC